MQLLFEVLFDVIGSFFAAFSPKMNFLISVHYTQYVWKVPGPHALKTEIEWYTDLFTSTLYVEPSSTCSLCSAADELSVDVISHGLPTHLIGISVPVWNHVSRSHPSWWSPGGTIHLICIVWEWFLRDAHSFCFLVCIQEMCTHHTDILCICSTSVKIRCLLVFGVPLSTSISLTLIILSSLSSVAMITTFVLPSWTAAACPPLPSSSTLPQPSVKVYADVSLL